MYYQFFTDLDILNINIRQRKVENLVKNWSVGTQQTRHRRVNIKIT